MKKGRLLAAGILALGLCSGVQAYAAPERMADGTVFDAQYYAAENPDVVAVYGTDAEDLYRHYVEYGREEGRMAHAGNEKMAGGQSASGVSVEPGDENYLRAGYLSVGYGYTLGESFDPAYGFVRQDWSSSPIYQELKAEILGVIAASGSGERIEGSCELVYTPQSQEDLRNFISIVDNLTVDLMKEGVAEHIYLMNNPADGMMHVGWDHDLICLYYINFDDLYNPERYPEVKGYY